MVYMVYTLVYKVYKILRTLNKIYYFKYYYLLLKPRHQLECLKIKQIKMHKKRTLISCGQCVDIHNNIKSEFYE